MLCDVLNNQSKAPFPSPFCLTLTSMSSSMLHGTSGLGIYLSPPESKPQRTEPHSHSVTMDEPKQYPILGDCPTLSSPDELGPILSSAECPEPRRRETVKHGELSAVPQAIEKRLNSSGSPDSVHTTLTIDVNEKDWKGTEIDTVLGDARSRLKSGARLLPHTPGQRKGLSLEKAKRRSRVDVDILLSSDVCVEGGYLQGLVKLQIRKGPKKSQSLLLSGGKIRIVGFESTTKEEERSTFYQFCASVSDVASGLDVVYSSEPDAEGFMKATEGVHVLPFAFQLTSSPAQGRPKGSMHSQSGASVRYIVMVLVEPLFLSSVSRFELVD